MSKKNIYFSIQTFIYFLIFISFSQQIYSQENEDEIVQTLAIKSRGLQRVGNAFESVWLIDNQTTHVPLRRTFEFDILHRFGTVKNGYDDFFGLYAPSNIRIGFGYTPINRLMIGLGFTKERLLWDVNWKYAILTAKPNNNVPVNVTYYGNIGIDTRKKENFVNSTDRYTYFHQLMVSKKLTRDFTVQGSISLSHFNAVQGYVDDAGEQKGKMKNDHLAFSILGRYKISDAFAFIGNYDQPITKHPTNNPNPNISFGVELATPLHAFQVFFGNYKYIVPQYNNVLNQNNYTDGAFLIGFNITRLLDAKEENLGDMMFKRKHEEHK